MSAQHTEVFGEGVAVHGLGATQVRNVERIRVAARRARRSRCNLVRGDVGNMQSHRGTSGGVVGEQVRRGHHTVLIDTSSELYVHGIGERFRQRVQAGVVGRKQVVLFVYCTSQLSTLELARDVVPD